MAYKNHWLRRAQDEFDTIYLYYLRRAGEKVAENRMAKILDATDILETMPNIGQLDSQYSHTPTYRYIVVLDYRIYYFIEEETVNIAAIWDCRQGEKVF